jgi:D-alanyl-D-alanine carboxypeptidase
LGASAASVVSACVATPRWAPGPEVVTRAVPADFNGIVAVGAGGRVIAQQSFGLADVERKLRVTPATRFAIGSASKWLTSVAVLRLVERGRLSLDRPVGAWLPELGAEAGARVTLTHLLSNRSGIEDLLVAALGADPALRTSSASALAMVKRFGGHPLAHPPGTTWDYAAFNWVVIRALVERVTGQSFEEAMQTLVFSPLGLSRAALASEGFEAVPDMAVGYAALLPPVRKMARVPGFVAASGNVVMTARDAVRAAHGIFATGFLTPQSRSALQTVLVADEDYALGGRVRSIGASRWAWEAGKVQGYRGLIAQDLNTDRTIVLFNNSDRDQADLAAMAEAIAAGVGPGSGPRGQSANLVSRRWPRIIRASSRLHSAP